ncbi:hypothetical protein C8Q80DRAFT_1266961 [Daedaleopsis nitida]|nr:hypothetical protein C8Q80DRAFT_1266961 [Daedaleopsis nitida]
MVNPSGSNQWHNGNVPPEDELIKELHQYAKEKLPLERRISRLQLKFGYHIKHTKLKELNKKYNIPTVRKPPSYEVATSLVCEKVGQDLHRRNGPSEVAKKLAVEGHAIPRSMTRKIMHENDPIGFEVRNPKARGGIVRSPLTAKGRMHEINCDGHEKFVDKSLRMGDVGFGIYGIREKMTSPVLLLRVVPNARYDIAVGHLYLDLVEELGMIPLQVTCDGGGETGYIRAIHTALRNALAPDLDPQVWKHFVSVRSVHNIPIENLWSRWTKSDGLNVRTVILEGHSNGLFDHTNSIHVHLFQWLWPKIVQVKLNAFREYWNCHKIRGQRNKLMPSGGSPNNMFLNYQAYGCEDLSIPVTDMGLVRRLRDELPVTREEAFRFVDDEFDAAAWEAYAEIGSPELSVETGWATFSRMGAVLQRMHDATYVY